MDRTDIAIEQLRSRHPDQECGPRLGHGRERDKEQKRPLPTVRARTVGGNEHPLADELQELSETLRDMQQALTTDHRRGGVVQRCRMLPRRVRINHPQKGSATAI